MAKVTILPTPLKLITLPKLYFKLFMSPILKNMVFGKPTFFSYTENSLEVSIIAEKRTADKEFGSIHTLTNIPGYKITNESFCALQIDSEDGVESSGRRITELSETLAKGQISIFYLSTYQTDFILVKEKYLSQVLSILESDQVYIVSPTNCNTPNTTILECLVTSQHPSKSFEYIKGTSKLSSVVTTVPVSTPNETSMTTSVTTIHTTNTTATSPIISPQNNNNKISTVNHLYISTSESSSKNPFSDRLGTLPSILQDVKSLEKKIIPDVSLSLVGLNRDFQDKWNLLLIDMLFYSDDDQKFFSYTVTDEGISLIADSPTLKKFPEHVLYSSTIPRPLRCIQVDLSQYGLDRYGIVFSMSDPLVQEHINLLYLSTFTTANILVQLEDLEKAVQILR